MDGGHELYVVIPLSVLAGVIVFSNVAVCLFICLDKTLRTFTNGFLVSLAVSDVLVGGILFPIYLTNPVGTAVVTGYLVSIILLAGVANLMAVTYDRYVALINPLEYGYKISKYFKKIIVASWSVPIIYSLLPLIWNTDLTNKAHKVYLLILQIVGVVIPYILIVFAYCRIFYRVKKSLQLRRRLSTNTMNRRRKERKRVTAEAKVAKVFLIVSVAFLLCWLPVIYITTAYLVDRLDILPKALEDVSFFTIALSSIVNPLVYSFMKPDIKRAIKAMIARIYERRASNADGQTEGLTMSNLAVRNSKVISSFTENAVPAVDAGNAKLLYEMGVIRAVNEQRRRPKPADLAVRNSKVVSLCSEEAVPADELPMML